MRFYVVFVTIGALAAGALAGPAAARHGTEASIARLEAAEEAMGTMFSIVLYGLDRARLEAAAGAAFDEAARIDRMLSNYRQDSDLSRINREAAAQPARVSAEVGDLLTACLRYSEVSAGAFDVTVGPLVKAWGFHGGDGALPRPEQLDAARKRVGYRLVRVDTAAGTVRFLRAGVELDPGGVGKGYAVDRMVAVLRNKGIERALVSAGGSSIYGLGSPPDEPDGWRVTIRAPADPNSAAAAVHLKNMSLSTSGGYEKFFRAGGRTYSHIIDPRTGYPARGTASVSVLAPRTLDSEVWTKPYFINGRHWTAAHKPSDMRVFFCAEGDPPACEWID